MKIVQNWPKIERCLHERSFLKIAIKIFKMTKNNHFQQKHLGFLVVLKRIVVNGLKSDLNLDEHSQTKGFSRQNNRTVKNNFSFKNVSYNLTKSHQLKTRAPMEILKFRSFGRTFHQSIGTFGTSLGQLFPLYSAHESCWSATLTVTVPRRGNFGKLTSGFSF